jgi:hypothetical protein
MTIRNGAFYFFYIKILGIRSRGKGFTADINGIRSASYSRNKTFKISRRGKKLREGVLYPHKYLLVH